MTSVNCHGGCDVVLCGDARRLMVISEKDEYQAMTEEAFYRVRPMPAGDMWQAVVVMGEDKSIQVSSTLRGC